MKEEVKTITITQTEADRIVWALHRLSDWMRGSDAPKSRKEDGIRMNNEIIDNIRAPFLMSF